MKKLIRYHSFEDLKSDTRPFNTNSSKSKDIQTLMENFLKLLRRKWLEEKELQKKKVEISGIR